MSKRGSFVELVGAVFVTVIVTVPVMALAQEMTSYSYDARGRVVTVKRTGGPVAGATTAYSYDKADNRKNVTVTASPKGTQTDTGGGATAKP